MIAGVVFLPSTWASTYPAILISLLRTCPGGGSMIATNYLYGLAKPDGLTIGMFQTFMYLQQLVASRFLNRSPRLKGVALIPFQNVDAGISELRRAVKELGMLGGMLPSNGEAIQGHLGNKIYWPLYEEAEKLGCALAVHVGCLHHMGLDSFSTYYPAHALGHPFSLMIQ